MTILRMQTDAVQDLVTQLNQQIFGIEDTVTRLNQLTQQLSWSWEGPSNDQFTAEMQQTVAQFTQLAAVGQQLATRLDREILEWILTAAHFGDSNLHGQVEKVLEIREKIADLGFGDDHQPPQSAYYDFPSLKLNADELVNFDPAYRHDEKLPDLMQELQKQLADQVKNGKQPELPPELVNQLSQTLGMSQSDIQEQFKKMHTEASNVYEKKGESSLFLSTLDADTHGFWGDRRQLLFGKVVGDNLGLHPVFGSILSPSGGLIGPGEGNLTQSLEKTIGDSTSRKAWEYHGVTHDASGYLKDNHGIGDGYRYAAETMNVSEWGLKEKFADGGVTITGEDRSVYGQLSGYLFWENYFAGESGGKPDDLIGKIIKDGADLPAQYAFEETVDKAEEVINKATKIKDTVAETGSTVVEGVKEIGSNVKEDLDNKINEIF